MSASARRDEIYFKDDVNMAATALIDLFGDNAPIRVKERVEEAGQKNDGEGATFWQAVADEIARRFT